jgi:hypothetical protein
MRDQHIGAKKRYQKISIPDLKIGTRDQHVGPENRYQAPVPIFPFSSVFYSCDVISIDVMRCFSASQIH